MENIAYTERTEVKIKAIAASDQEKGRYV